MKMERKLSAVGVFSIGAGSMISSGLFVLPSVAYAEAGAWVIAAYFVAGLLMVPAVFTQLELATAIPKSGGTYFFLERIMGTPMGILAGVASWLTIALKSAFALLGIGLFVSLLSPAITDTHVRIVGVGLCVLFGVLNILSVESSSGVQNVMVAVLLAILVAFIVVGFVDTSFEGVASRLETENVGALLPVTGMVFISYGGITKIANIAEEVRDPRKSLVRGMTAAFLVVQLLYVVVVLLLTAMFPPGEFALSVAPLSDAASRFTILPNGMFVAVTVAAILAFVTTGNAGIMTASRVPMSMSRDVLLPSWFGRVSPRFGTPVAAIILTSAVMASVVAFLDVAELAQVASAFMLFLFFSTNLALLVVRLASIHTYRPTFRAPLFPYLQIIGIVVYGALLATIGTLPLIVIAAMALLSILWYVAYARPRSNRKSAFVRVVKTLAGPELEDVDQGLEDELLEILLERNEVIEDTFDAMVRDAVVVDMDAETSRDDLFDLVGREVAARWEVPADKVIERLNEREGQASTLLYPGVALPHAIPHIILEGTGRLELLLVRNRHGIRWTAEGETAYSAFVLIGTKDQRDQHLRSLVAIAQLLQSDTFQADWDGARNVHDLRRVLLLGERRRHA